jgi:hypothetical protein
MVINGETVAGMALGAGMVVAGRIEGMYRFENEFPGTVVGT